jgi:hypothetical protein
MSSSQLTGSYGYINLTTSTYANPVTVTSTGTVAGGPTQDGLLASTAWTIVNDGSISGGLDGIDLKGGTFGNSAALSGAVDNTGSIHGGNDGVYLYAGGAVSNAAGGTITGGNQGVNVGGASVYNAGSISGGSDGVYLFGGAVSNAASGSITGGVDGVLAKSAAGYVSNAGYIGGASEGVDLQFGVPGEPSGTVDNTGTIHGGTFGVYLYSDGVGVGGYVSNGAGGTITAGGQAVAVGSGDTVYNAGLIGGGADGVYVFEGGVVGNAAGGAITGGVDGVLAKLGVALVYNAGSIGGGADGVDLSAGGVVANAAGGKIGGGAYGVDVSGADAAVYNAGVIGGGADAIELGASISNLLVVDAGAVFDGKVIATDSGAVNTIELTSSASAGTLSGGELSTGLGKEFQGFQTVDIDAGAHWDIKGLKAAFADTTISGFNGHDALDLTNLTYASGATAVLTGDTLAVTSDGMTIDITMTDTTGMHFYAHDVGGDVLVNEKPACYLRGTQVTTDRGPVAVEELKVGDRLITLSGAAMPIRWIGRRSYAGWAAAGNPGVRPVRFKAGSLADGIPSRDLLVSPEHAMFIDGALIPARHLVNGASIVNAEAMDEIHYFHLELDRHAVIFAEDAASETYVDDDNRGMFHNVYEYYAEHPEATRGLRAEYCAPRVEDGFTLEAVRNALAARAARLRPDGTAAPVAALGGNLDLVSRTLIEGWAFAPETPNEPVALVILDNGAVIGEVMADRYRADLEACGVGDGRHAFRLALPRGLTPEFSHEIEVRRESDWTRLQGSGVVLEPEASALAA